MEFKLRPVIVLLRTVRYPSLPKQAVRIYINVQVNIRSQLASLRRTWCGPSLSSFSLAWLNGHLKLKWHYFPVCLSRAWLNWLIGGGIFNLVWRTAFCLWRRMYFGHRTKRLKSRLGWISWPIPKLRGRFSNRGFTTRFTSGFLTARGAAATFFPFFFPYKIPKNL